jgi:hypothetical protein
MAMKTATGWVAGAALLVLAACSRREPDMNIAGAEYNQQTGILSTKEGLQLNATSAVGGCMSQEDARRPPSDFTPERRGQLLSCLNNQTVRQVSPQLPRQLDAITSWDRISADGPVTTYHYTISRPASSLGPNAGQQLETMVRRTVCAQGPMRQTIEFGGAFVYRYDDNQGSLVHQFRIDAC